MQNYRKAISLSLILLAVVAATAMAALRSQEQKTERENQTSGNQFPVADITASESTDKIRHARSSKYDIRGITAEQSKSFRIKETDSTVVLDLTPSHAPPLEAIPISESDTVVIGEVVRAEAYLSNDKTTVYSEFQVRLGEVLQSIRPEILTPNAIISVDRRGGRVRFPSGKVLLRGVYGRNMPQVQKRYLFFLKSDAESQSFSITTAYELRNGRVFPLDGNPENESVSGPLAVYKLYRNMDEAAFRNEVISAIQGVRR